MTNRKRNSVFHIHPLLFGLFFLAFITGSFMEMIIIFTIVVIHEFGHLSMALFFRWRIRKVMFWPFGGVMETDDYFSRPNREELYVVLAGPVQHIWIHFFLIYSNGFGLLSPDLIQFAVHYNIVLLLFNLIPIYPLDGGKLCFLLFSQFLPFQKAMDWTIIFSVMTVIIGLSLAIMEGWGTLHTVLLAIFLLLENRIEWNRRKFVFIRHLMARQNRTNYEGYKMLKNKLPPHITVYRTLSGLRKGCYHQFVIPVGERLVTVDEQSCLDAYFNQQQPNIPMGSIAKWQDKTER
ncbi:M50 family metallopeptidase [Salirhabdus salicampi]|uniref:M50 family metallopeptidase n=1 Tax=Salirhabdus salicampi TaxID=476102 RepID=UPI0020C55F3F|nr:M50 family metallopeptidase [Salirhabdus salicampi]MCP8617007.1 M50 family metallopeptidase [Salirhabdus salicampi]